MTDHRHTVRTLYRHDWSGPEDWAQSLGDLAVLSDKEIGRLFNAEVPRGSANEDSRAR